MKKYHFFLMLIITISSLNSCSDLFLTPSIGSMTLKVNGKDWVAQSVKFEENGKAINAVEVIAYKDNEEIHLDIVHNQQHQNGYFYNLPIDSLNLTNSLCLYRSKDNSGSVGKPEITVTNMNADMIEGNFSCNCKNIDTKESLYISDGYFKISLK